jgi:hypothetical protein
LVNHSRQPSFDGNRLSAFSPACPVGYKLQVKTGKDSCVKGKPEVIVAPNRKVSR